MQTWWRGDNELDADQKAIMELPPDGSFAVTGPPGSGKTNLLLMRGAYLSALSRNIAVLVMNRTLAEFIKSGASGYGVPTDAVMTSRQFISALADEIGTPLTRGLTFEEGRSEALEVLKRAAISNPSPTYDAILIDEAQDHSEEELRFLRVLARDIYLTADARQLIYRNGSQDDRFKSLVSEHRQLRFHYRSAMDICDLADEVGSRFTSGYDKISPTCRYPVSSPKAEITIVRGSLDEQGEKIAERIRLQLRAFRGELIGVFAPIKQDAQHLVEILTEKGFADLMTVQVGTDGYMDMRPERPICVSTVHGAKGLEFRAVHFAGAEHVQKHGGTQKRLTFTGITRAKTALSIYHDAPLPNFFNSSVARWRADEGPSKGWRSIFDAR